MQLHGYSHILSVFVPNFTTVTAFSLLLYEYRAIADHLK